MLGVRIDRTRCIGAGNCIHIAPTAFEWLPGDHAKIDVVDLESVEEELVREAALACPTQAITIEVTTELLDARAGERRGRARVGLRALAGAASASRAPRGVLLGVWPGNSPLGVRSASCSC